MKSDPNNPKADKTAEQLEEKKIVNLEYIDFETSVLTSGRNILMD